MAGEGGREPLVRERVRSPHTPVTQRDGRVGPTLNLKMTAIPCLPKTAGVAPQPGTRGGTVTCTSGEVRSQHCACLGSQACTCHAAHGAPEPLHLQEGRACWSGVAPPALWAAPSWAPGNHTGSAAEQGRHCGPRGHCVPGCGVKAGRLWWAWQWVAIQPHGGLCGRNREGSGVARPRR